MTNTPRAFAGDGAGWHKNPVCRIRVTPVVDFRVNGSPRTITAGRHGGKSIRQTLRPGSGLHVLSFVANGAALPTNNYTIVP